MNISCRRPLPLLVGEPGRRAHIPGRDWDPEMSVSCVVASGSSSTRRWLLSPLPPLVLGAILRFVGLGAQCLWYDEAFTAWMVSLSWRDMLTATAGDVHPPLWYALTKLMITDLLGTSEWVLRLPAALLSVLALWLVWRLAVELGLGRRVVVATLWILAVSPFQIAYAQEARMYALLLVGVLVAALGLVEGWWPIYALGVTLVMYSHNLGAIYWIVLVVLSIGWFLIKVRKKSASVLSFPGFFFLSNATAAAFYLPWSFVALDQVGAVGSAFWVQKPSLGGLALILHKLYWHTTPPVWAGVPTAFLSGLAVVAIAVTTVKALLCGKRAAGAHKIIMLTTLTTLGFGPLLVAFVASLVWRPVLIHRTMIGCTPFLAMLLAYALVHHRRARWLALAAAPLVAFVVVGGVIQPFVSQEIVTQKGDVGRFVLPVRERLESGDAVLHTSIASYVLLSYYAPDFDHYLWSQANDLSQSLTDQTKDAMGMRQTSIEELLDDYTRVFVYYSDTPVTSAAEVAETERIRATYPVAWAMSFLDDSGGLVESGVYLVEREQGGH